MRRMGMAAIAIVLVLAGAKAINARDQQGDNLRRDDQRGGDQRHDHECGEATLRGTYGIQIQGTRFSPTAGHPIESVIGIVIRDYDGHGQFSQIDNVKGSISGITPNRPGFGTYQVNDDCTAVATLHPSPTITIEEQLVIVADGREVRSATILPADVMVTAVQRKINVR